MWRKGNPFILLEMQTGTATVENSVELSQTTENRMTVQPRNFPLEYLFEKGKTQTVILRFVHPSVHSSIIYNCQDMEAT